MTASKADGAWLDPTAPNKLVALIRNLPRLKERIGPAGLAELILARALPETLSYSRVVVIVLRGIQPMATPGPGVVVRRLVYPDSGLRQLMARVGAVREPGIPIPSPSGLVEGFARGDEAWMAEVEGSPAHARFVRRDELHFAGVHIPLQPDERVTTLVVTLPGHRGRKLAEVVVHAASKKLAEEGASTMFGAIMGFNRRWLARELRGPETRRVATAHAFSVLGRRWTLIVPALASDREMLEQRGLRTGRWAREPERTSAAERWDGAAAGAAASPYLDPEMAAAKRRAHLDLLDSWLPDLAGRAVLKTDLWEEGVAGDELLFTLARRARSARGVDVSPTIVAAASRAAIRAGVSPRLTGADVRDLPVSDGALDVVVSTSTIDHLAEHERLPAMDELRRVLAPGGVLVVTCDNADNVGDPLLQLAARLGVVPFPLGPGMSAEALAGLLRRAGFDIQEHAYLVHGPRVLTTALVRAVRLLPERIGEAAVGWLLRVLDAIGRRSPRRMAAFVAVRATPANGWKRPAAAGAETD